jgi:hypothetical protein
LISECSSGLGAAASDVATADPPVGVGPQLALQLHQAPDTGAVDPQVGLDMDGRSLDGLEVDAEELGAALQGSGGRARVGSWASQAGMPGSLGEHMFEHQWDKAGEHPGHDVFSQIHGGGPRAPAGPVSVHHESGPLAARQPVSARCLAAAELADSPLGSGVTHRRYRRASGPVLASGRHLAGRPRQPLLVQRLALQQLRIRHWL